MGPLSVEDPGVPDLLRDLAPTVLGVLARRHRDDFEACEDALQEALLAAAGSWPSEGVPANPTGWLVTTASRRLVETWRRDAARRRREENDLRRTVEVDPVPDEDDTLALLVLCAHPALTPPAQVALTLRAVGGLTTAEIARGLLVGEATVAQRISRAKARIAAAGAVFASPTDAELAVRVPIVLEVLYRVFTEGHTASSGDELQRGDLTAEALRLARRLHASVPEHGEAAGLLALMLLTEARRAARSRPDGSLVPLAEQDRSRWDTVAIAEGVGLLEGALPSADPGPYQVQAAIAAVHAEAGRAEDTDWEQILGLYGALEALAPGPMVTLNRLVALSMVDGADAALLRLDALDGEPGGDLAGHHRVDAVRAHLLERLDRRVEAAVAYRRAARTTLSAPEQRYLAARAARLDPGRSA